VKRYLPLLVVIGCLAGCSRTDRLILRSLSSCEHVTITFTGQEARLRDTQGTRAIPAAVASRLRQSVGALTANLETGSYQSPVLDNYTVEVDWAGVRRAYALLHMSPLATPPEITKVVNLMRESAPGLVRHEKANENDLTFVRLLASRSRGQHSQFHDDVMSLGILTGQNRLDARELYPIWLLLRMYRSGDWSCIDRGPEKRLRLGPDELQKLPDRWRTADRVVRVVPSGHYRCEGEEFLFEIRKEGKLHLYFLAPSEDFPEAPRDLWRVWAAVSGLTRW